MRLQRYVFIGVESMKLIPVTVLAQNFWVYRASGIRLIWNRMVMAMISLRAMRLSGNHVPAVCSAVALDKRCYPVGALRKV